MEIKWITRNRMYYPKGFCKDVGITVSPKSKIIRFSFRNNCEKKITKDLYAVIGIADNKVFFKESDMYNGLKFTQTGKTKNKYLRVNNDEFFYQLKSFSGEYELFFDKTNNLYYIDLTENMKK